MKLEKLLMRLKYRLVQGTTDICVGKVTNDTRELKAGDVYVCLVGTKQDGHTYAVAAVRAGAAALIVQKGRWQGRLIEEPNRAVTIIELSDSRYALAMMSAAYYGYPAEQLRLIGVTGTKGKTTTAWMLQHILKDAGHKTGLIGTIQIDNGQCIQSCRNTTPESCVIQRLLREMADNGCDSAVMEVSSQGMKQQRLAGIPFDIGIFTNLGRDHIGLGEHDSMEEYAQCKHLLFLQCRVGIGNIDDPCYDKIFDRTGCQRLTFGIDGPADYRGTGLVPIRGDSYLGIRYRLLGGSADMDIELRMPGRFNVYNSLGVIASLREWKVSDSVIWEGLRRVQVPGRMEQIAAFDGRMVFVDYAHNAMSLGQVLKMLRTYRPGRLIAVFGCGGNRAAGRRREMGERAAVLADLTIVTTDNPRFEEPDQIIADIVSGIRQAKEAAGDFRVIPDRREAIRCSLQESRPGDIIVIAGKGHETYQEVKGIRYHMDDGELVRDILQKEILREEIRREQTLREEARQEE